MHVLSKISLALILAFWASDAWAQKPDKEKLGYYNYLQPPLSAELGTEGYYFLSVKTDDNDAFRRKLFEQEFQVAPFLPTNTDTEPDFTIEVIEGVFSYGTPKRKSFQEKYKANGAEKSRSIYYYQGDVRYHYTLKVWKGEEEIFREDVNGTDNISADKSESMSIAHDNYVKHKTRVKQDMLPERADELASAFNNQFNTVEKTVHLNAIKIKERKFDYPQFNKAFEDLERAYDVLKSSPEPTAESKAKLREVIATWTTFVKDATPGEKKSRKDADVTAAAYYNLGVAYFLSEQYDDASQAFARAASYDEKVMYDVDHFIKVTKDLAQRDSFSLAQLAD